jgi:hypothetical protein
VGLEEEIEQDIVAGVQVERPADRLRDDQDRGTVHLE